jgi:hypothetical protein
MHVILASYLSVSIQNMKVHAFLQTLATLTTYIDYVPGSQHEWEQLDQPYM